MKFEDDECTKYEKTIHDIVKTWWGNENKFKNDSHGTYSTTSCDAHIMCTAMMFVECSELKVLCILL
jgi:hypothetical protein